MIEVTNRLREAINSVDIIWLVIFLVVGFMWHFRQVYDFLKMHHRQRLDRLVEASKCDHLDEPFKKFIQNQLNKEYWYYVTDISTENKYRDLIIALYNLGSGEISFNHFRRASSHLKLADEKVSIVLKWHDTFGYYMNIGIAILFGLVGLVICLSPAILQPEKLMQILQFFALGASFIVIALFSLSQTSAVYSARMIKKLIDNQSAQS